MSDIRNYIIGIVAVFIIAKILTFVKPYKVALIKRATLSTEKKYTDAQKSGEKKKAAAFKLLKLFLVEADDTTSQLIDAVVSVANSKNTEMTTALKSVTTNEVNTQLTQLKNKITKEE